MNNGVCFIVHLNHLTLICCNRLKRFSVLLNDRYSTAYYFSGKVARKVRQIFVTTYDSLSPLLVPSFLNNRRHLLLLVLTLMLYVLKKFLFSTFETFFEYFSFYQILKFLKELRNRIGKLFLCPLQK